MRKLKYYIIILFVCLLALPSCMVKPRKYVIGVSQCSKDSWREKFETELKQSIYFNDDVELIMYTADDDVDLQYRQIDSLINRNVDLLVVSPQKSGKLAEAIGHANTRGIPVIFFDRKIDDVESAAFMGADNYYIGKMLGEYAVAKLHGVGNIVEICGESGSSPAEDRHRGFAEAIKNHPGIKVVGQEIGDWKQESGVEAMEKILHRLEADNENVCIDLVFGGNDRMALGARQVFDIYAMTKPNGNVSISKNIIYLGVDALPTAGGGIEKVRDGLLTASAIYPTHGNELIDLALKILRGESYEKNIGMETSLVTSDNANVLLLQYKEIQNQDKYISQMNTHVNEIKRVASIQQKSLLFVIFMVAIIGTLLVLTLRAYRIKKELYKELQERNAELNLEKEKVELQRDQLEEQRDQLLDITTKDEDIAEQAQPIQEDSVGEYKSNNEFIARFVQCVNDHMADSSLSVEDIGQELCLSRVQLYRRVKTLTGKTPVEIIREERLKKAHVLLSDSSLTISEIAYRVGFSTPSYFAKCYKDFYGISPSGK